MGLCGIASVDMDGVSGVRNKASRSECVWRMGEKGFTLCLCENGGKGYVSLIRKKFCWGTIFLIGLKRYRDPKEEPTEKEPLMELKEIG
ncbi:hypothetical protein Tco_0787970 [Tanacetum coccineum]